MDSVEPTIQPEEENQNPTQNIPLTNNKGIIHGEPPLARIGEEYQVQIPDIQADPTASYQLRMSPAVPIIWAPHHTPLPGSEPSRWSQSEKDAFLLAFYIFGKKLNLLRRFVTEQGHNRNFKTMGDVLAYYYTEFYKTEAYNKAKMKRCVIGPSIFTGWRQLEVLSRLLHLVPKQEHGTLQEVFKAYNEERSSFEEFIFVLKAIAGTHSLVQVIGMGKGKSDLTRIRPDPTRTRNQIQTGLEIPVGKQWSSLSSDQILKFLNGSFRLSKARSNDLFWEAIWPKLLVRGWTSYQPKDHPLVFLVPEIPDFSRENLVKGIHYFDSISDLLSKIYSDPDLIKNNENATDNSNNNNNNNGNFDTKIVNQGTEIMMKFTIIDTSLVNQEPNKIRSLRSLPLARSSQSQSDTSASEILLSGLDGSVKNVIQDKELKSKEEKCLTPVCKKRRLVVCKKEKENYENAPALSETKEVLQPSIDLNVHDIKSENEINDQQSCKKFLDVNTEKEGSSVENNRRHGTRNRPPTTKALEALALGFIGTTKKKKNREIMCHNSDRPTRRARLSDEKNLEGRFGQAKNDESLDVSVGLCVCGEIQSDTSLTNDE